jgi:hypothetical protein
MHSEDGFPSTRAEVASWKFAASNAEPAQGSQAGLNEAACGGRFRVPEASDMEDSRLAIKVAVGLEE